jgi:hypothetical protein
MPNFQASSSKSDNARANEPWGARLGPESDDPLALRHLTCVETNVQPGDLPGYAVCE